VISISLVVSWLFLPYQKDFSTLLQPVISYNKNDGYFVTIKTFIKLKKIRS